MESDTADTTTESFTLIDEIYNYDQPSTSNTIIVPHQRLFNPLDYEVVLDFQVPFPPELLYGSHVESIHAYSVTKGTHFYHTLLATYYQPEELERQFKLDVSRSVMYLNQHRVTDPIQAVHYLQHKYQDKGNLILALCTQAVYATPFEWIYFSLPPDYHLVERDGTGNLNRKIKIMLEDHQLSIWKILRIIRFTTDPVTGVQEAVTYREVGIVITVEDLTSGTDDVSIDVWLGPVLA